VDLPPLLIGMLNSDTFKPAPREQFKRQLNDVHIGQQITIPSLGQTPKHYGKGYQGESLLVTEQMMDVWQELSADSDRSIKRVLSGPMGVGKSYLALFLAAKAYAEGWLLLYISDANELNKLSAFEIGYEICARFLALNKDILTIADFKVMTMGNSTDSKEAVTIAAGFIFGYLLKQLKRKTLLVIDEHGALFEPEPPIPKIQPLLNPLMQLNAWNEERKGTRVILTGTAHAKFEREHIKVGMREWMVFVTPLSSFIFNKLLDMSHILSRETIRDEVKEITNRVPRELVDLSFYVRTGLEKAINASATDSKPLTVTEMDTKILEATNEDVFLLLQNYKKDRRRQLFMEVETYFYKKLDESQRYAQRCALAAMFLPRKDGDTDFNYNDFDYPFMDLGLVYRLKVGARVQYHPLCGPARGALLDIYKSMPLPKDVTMAIQSGHMDGLKFEDALLYQLYRYQDVTLKATNLVGVEQTPVAIKFKHFKMLEDPPLKTNSDVLLRCYPGYPRFDFILGYMFIQISISDFTTHNRDSADLAKAFKHPEPPGGRPTRSFDKRNQIEKYLDSAFGGCDRHENDVGCHKAVIDEDSKRFIVKRDDRTVDDFRIVYIRGSPGLPNHTGKISEFPDVLHISFDELKIKLFGEFLEWSQ